VTLARELEAHERAWNERSLLRSVYRRWFREIVSELARVEGATIELGAGIAKFKDVYADAVASDVEPTPWADAVVDAEALPYENGSVANLVLIDVLHHLSRPARFFDEARRVLVPGGRVVILDPYCSLISTVAYRRFHHERTDPDVSAFADDASLAASPMTANQARATLIFFRELGSFHQRWPELAVVRRRRMSFLLYPLSGGFSRPQLVPSWLEAPVRLLERALTPLAPLLAFRCLVVLERRAGARDGKTATRA
jgi:SAM-dependent methyltransferase